MQVSLWLVLGIRARQRNNIVDFNRPSVVCLHNSEYFISGFLIVTNDGSPGQLFVLQDNSPPTEALVS